MVVGGKKRRLLEINVFKDAGMEIPVHSLVVVEIGYLRK